MCVWGGGLLEEGRGGKGWGVVCHSHAVFNLFIMLIYNQKPFSPIVSKPLVSMQRLCQPSALCINSMTAQKQYTSSQCAVAWWPRETFCTRLDLQAVLRADLHTFSTLALSNTCASLHA